MAGPHTVRTPSTIGNFGPGFDVTSLAIDHGGDRLTVREADEDRLTLEGPGADTIPQAWGSNCASVAYDHLRASTRNELGDDARVHLHIEKGVWPGSGLGSSASSSAAGALAFAARHRDHPWTVERLVEAATHGEGRVAGAHGDDVAAAILGGLGLVHPGGVTRVEPPTDLHIAIVRPEFELETRRMREAVGTQVGVADAVKNLGRLAAIVDACHRDDTSTIARSLQDHIAAPGRRPHIPFFEAAHRAAEGAGARSIAISGSGPSLFTIAQDPSTAHDVAAAMAAAVIGTGIEAEAIVCRPERRHVWKEALGR